MKKNISSLAILLVCLCVLLFPHTSAAYTFQISQETSPGLGDFDSNILWFVDTFTTDLTSSEFYSYADPIAVSYNGNENGGPLPGSNRTYEHRNQLKTPFNTHRLDLQNSLRIAAELSSVLSIISSL